jgi:PmbA protein
MLGEVEARRLCEQTLVLCGGQDAEVLLFSEDLAQTRFSKNTLEPETAETNTSLVLQIFTGTHAGTATIHHLDADALGLAVARARSNAETTPEDPDYPGLPEPAQYACVEAFDADTADYPSDVRQSAAAELCKSAQGKGLDLSGAFTTGCGEVCVANSRGLLAYTASTNADFEGWATSEDSSGYVHATAWRVADLEVNQLGSQAVEKAALGHNPRPVEMGEYSVVVDPYVTEELLLMLNYHSMGALDVFNGRSWMNGLIGKQALSEKVTIWDDGLDLAGLPMPFDFEGMPKQRVTLVQNGVVRGPVYDRTTAAKLCEANTGHAMPPTFRRTGPLATNLFMAEGDVTVDEMIRSTEKGLYISRFWYTHLLSPIGCEVSGMTRDGGFMIENGQISYPVRNLRFMQSYVEALSNVEMVGKETRLLGSALGGIAVRAPALKISKFNFIGSVE